MKIELTKEQMEAIDNESKLIVDNEEWEYVEQDGKFVEDDIEPRKKIVPIVPEGLIKTKLFISDMNPDPEQNTLDDKINNYIYENNITNIINVQTNFNANNIYSALLVYNT